MKYIDNGCFHSVSVTKAEVVAFKDTWPCSGLPERAHWFQFDKRNGDLVDMRGPGDYDGPDLLGVVSGRAEVCRSGARQKWGDCMSRTRRQIVPQYDFKWPDEPFALMREVAVDGAAVVAEREQSAKDRLEALSQQAPLLAPGWDAEGGR